MAEIVIATTNTLVNLLDAFNGESNAHTRYLSFAAKADAEGWHGVASLFCAAAYAEHVHAGNHARVIRQLGGTPRVNVQQVEVRSTLENLRGALGGERFEIETVYPEFILAAEEANDHAAVISFQWAMEAEKTHARLFEEAITLVAADNKHSWVAKQCPFYVCPTCGYTSQSPDEQERCPVCKGSSRNFEVIR